MHYLRPARSTAALATAISLAAAAFVVGSSSAAVANPSAAGASNDKPALIVPQSPETILGEIQQQLAIVMGKNEPPVEHVDALTRALLAAHGGVRDREAIADLSAVVSGVIARGSLPGELLERLSQNLYAAISPRKLADQEASLLALDVALLLQEAGGDTDDVTEVLGRLQRLCPGATLGAAAMPKPSPGMRSTPRVLSVLTRPASGS